VERAECRGVCIEWSVLSVGREEEEKWRVSIVDVKLFHVPLVYFPYITIPCINKLRGRHEVS
jgi:hypothetical protein